MQIKVNERIIDVTDVTSDGEKVYMYAPKYKKLIILRFNTVFEAYTSYQIIIKKEIYDATGQVMDIIDK